LAGLDREREEWCEDLTAMDMKDYWFVSSREGWKTLTIPNNSEQQYYKEFDFHNHKGWIFVCICRCDWGKCAEGDMAKQFGWWWDPNKEKPSEEELKAMGHIEMEVNGVRVTEASDLHLCTALMHDDPDPNLRHIWKPNAEGKYEFRVRIADTDPTRRQFSYLRISSFIFL
jgi:hypothetical protein